MGDPDDREDGRLAPQNNHLTGVWTKFFYRSEMGEVRKWSKKAINLANIPRNGTSQAGHVLIPSSRPSTGGAGSGQGSLVYSQAEGQGSLRQAILYDHSNKSNAKQVQETVPTRSPNWLPLCKPPVSGWGPGWSWGEPRGRPRGGQAGRWTSGSSGATEVKVGSSAAGPGQARAGRALRARSRDPMSQGGNARLSRALRWAGPLPSLRGSHWGPRLGCPSPPTLARTNPQDRGPLWSL